MTGWIRRRSLILRGLAGLTVVAAGGVVWRASNNGAFNVGEGAAYEPWHDWHQQQRVGPLAIVHGGILAASAHNTQPWRFDLSEDRVALKADYERHLGSFDPHRREMTLSLGCALENMALTAAAEGFAGEIELTPGTLGLGAPADGDRPVAVMNLERGAPASSDLYRAIADRHTHRGRYVATQTISETLKSEMRALAAASPGVGLTLVDAEPAMSRLGELTVEATRQIITDAQMAADSARWFRFDRAGVDAHRDGVTVDTFGLPPLLNVAVKILPTPSQELTDRQWLEATRDVHVATAPLFGLITVADLYDRATALEAGRLWQRLHLWAATRGLAAQPLNQVSERVDREAELGEPPRTAAALADLTGSEKARPTFVFRMGYANRDARLSPRRAIESVLVS